MREELKDFSSDQSVYLKMKAAQADFACEYSLDGKTWSAIGSTLDGKQLSTKVAGGYIGAYLGLYAFSETVATASFDWATYREINTKGKKK
jgi:alpha-N-arabinofuranosidase